MLSVCVQEHFGDGLGDWLDSLLMCKCVSLISLCCLRGSTSVALRRWGCEQPIAIRDALFLLTSSFCGCVAFVSRCHAGCAYVSMGLMYYFYTWVMSSLGWPNVVLVSARRTQTDVSPSVMLSVGGMIDMLLSLAVLV